MKVYMVYIKGNKSPYAYTINKDYINLFIEQRGQDMIYVKPIEMNKYEFMVFSNQNRGLQLGKDYLDDGEHTIEIIASVDESSQLSESCDYIQNTVLTLETSFKKLPLKKKYLNSITKITSEISRRDNNNPTLRVDTISLFYHLFKNTFTEVNEYDEKETLT